MHKKNEMKYGLSEFTIITKELADVKRRLQQCLTMNEMRLLNMRFTKGNMSIKVVLDEENLVRNIINVEVPIPQEYMSISTAKEYSRDLKHHTTVVRRAIRYMKRSEKYFNELKTKYNKLSIKENKNESKS